MRHSLLICLALAGAGCLQASSVATSASSSAASSSGTLAGSSAGGVSSTSAAISASTSTTNSGSSSSTGGGTGTTTGSSAGSTTGTSSTGTPPVYTDGGYVFCTAMVTLDGGGAADLAWECDPGTYFCATDGTATCAQCLSDVDCANEDLPTFDLERPHCDLASGIRGYQGFCQQCIIDTQCASCPSRPTCDCNPGDVRPPIVTSGFETCIPTPPGCPYGEAPMLGGCGKAGCATNDDCANAIEAGGLLSPFCVQGTCVASPDGSACPNCTCAWWNPTCGSLGTTPLTRESDNLCSCTDASQCGASWPICEIPAGADAGTCGCDNDAQCGDSALKCFAATQTNPAGYCGVPCSSPGSPACGLLNPELPVCDEVTGECSGCGSDNDCQKHAGGPTDGPLCRLDGLCGCARDSDCPEGLTCQNITGQSRSDGLLGLCALPQSCGPGTCFTGSCDVDSGSCIGCIADIDCWSAFSRQGYHCDQSSGSCVGCRDDRDCGGVTGEFVSYQTYCDPSSHQCTGACTVDEDCVGNGYGAHCLGNRCGCGSDDECAGNVAGSRCDTDAGDPAFGYCHCLDTSDCPSGLACDPSLSAACISGCSLGNACAPGLFCDPSYNCRPRCQPDGGGCPGSAPLCDLANIVGQNLDGGEDGGEAALWCYACLGEADCSTGEACGYDHTCGPCYLGVCAAGEECFEDARCHPFCDAGLCPPGQVCGARDVFNPGVNVCTQCVSPSDCPSGEGCDSLTHTCGTCLGPNAQTLSKGCSPLAPGCNQDCPPDAVCSNYWMTNIDNEEIPHGVCLENCDRLPCPTGKSCATLPELSLDHKYCFGCLSDADCTDAGPGAYCDDLFRLTFTCQPGSG